MVEVGWVEADAGMAERICTHLSNFCHGSEVFLSPKVNHPPRHPPQVKTQSGLVEKTENGHSPPILFLIA